MSSEERAQLPASPDAAAEQATDAEGGEEAAVEVPITKKQRSWGEQSLKSALP